MKENLDEKVIDALQECLKQQTLFTISLRDIAKVAEVSHQKMLYHYKNREGIIHLYTEYVKDWLLEECLDWFNNHNRKEEESSLSYLNRFMNYVTVFSKEQTYQNATIQVYVMGQYDQEVAIMIQKIYHEWKKEMAELLEKKVGVTSKQLTETMMIMICGTFLCNYNNLLSLGEQQNSIDSLSELTKERHEYHE
ncbi:MAG: TetR/AcrR family transcriptional regulator [Enterococcus sp.]